MRALFVLSLAATLVLSACGTPATEGEPSASPTTSPVVASPSPTASASPTPSPTSDPTPTPSATATVALPELDCEGWDDASGDASAIGFYRFAGICVGMSFDEAEASAPGLTINVPSACPWYGEIVSEEPLYVIGLSGPDAPGDYISLFILRWTDDIANVRPLEMPRTERGLTIGNTRDDVLAAYPDAVEVTTQDPARGERTQLVVTDRLGFSYAFDIEGGLVTEIAWGEGLSNGGPYGDLCSL